MEIGKEVGVIEEIRALTDEETLKDLIEKEVELTMLVRMHVDMLRGCRKAIRDFQNVPKPFHTGKYPFHTLDVGQSFQMDAKITPDMHQFEINLASIRLRSRLANAANTFTMRHPGTKINIKADPNCLGRFTVTRTW